jgi:hypothetical protein
MRLRAVLLLALFALLCVLPSTRLAADKFKPPTSAGVIQPIPAGDTHCPAATNALFYCGGMPPTAYLAIGKIKGSKNYLCRYVDIFGTKDMTTCPGYTLIHVERVAKPLVPPLPCAPADCNPTP